MVEIGELEMCKMFHQLPHYNFKSNDHHIMANTSISTVEL